MNKKYELYAFWKYDLFPFLLFAPINSKDICDDGRVKPDAYGRVLFRPVKITSFAYGEKIANELRAMEKEIAKEIAKINEKYNSQLNTLRQTHNFD